MAGPEWMLDSQEEFLIRPSHIYMQGIIIFKYCNNNNFIRCLAVKND